jgi:hypothetical protein
VKLWFLGGLAVSLLLISCAAKSAPTRIMVKAGDAYSGSLRLSPCEKNAQDPVSLDAKGHGTTSACPLGDDIEIVVIKSGKTIYIARENINVARAGDGFPVTISAPIP